MKLLCMSDLHGHLPPASSAWTADVAVIAGDVTPALNSYYGGNAPGLYNQSKWVIDTFMPWLNTLPVRHVVLTWGNHDHIGEHPELLSPAVWPANMHMLVNRSVTIEGVSFHGVPQTPRFCDWAFNDDDNDIVLGSRWAQVPEGTDVLVSHGPPRGACDTIRRGEPNLGSLTQSRWLHSEAPNHPRVVICGHIHGSGGREGGCGSTRIYNVALINEAYQLVREPKLITLETV